MGRFSPAKAADNALQSEAAAYFEMVSGSGMSYSGLSALTPCTRADITLLGVVGASAEAFGESMGETRKEIVKKQFTQINPPGAKLCKDLVSDSVIMTPPKSWILDEVSGKTQLSLLVGVANEWSEI
jgi:hypothetical protein